MKKALISPLEFCENGYRIADITEAEFDVAPPFFWIDCGDEITAESHWYDPKDETAKLKDIYNKIAATKAVDTAQPVVTGAVNV